MVYARRFFIMGILGSFLSLLISVVSRLIAITGHEVAHGFVSDKLGDPTPRREGRLSFNPLAHLDITGTILMLLTGFGWAKPVAIDPRYYKDSKKGMALVAVAGPLSNLIMAFLGLLVYAIFFIINVKTGALNTLTGFFKTFSMQFAYTNLCFMIFNLIPIPPLDGSRILGMFLSNRTYYNLMRYERYSMYIIMALSLTGAFSRIIGTGVNFVFGGIINILNIFVRMAL